MTVRKHTTFAFAVLSVMLVSEPAISQTKARPRAVPAPQSPAPAVPVADELTAARDATDTFLTGIKIADLPEGREMLSRVQWITGDADSTVETPRFTEANTLFERLFDTDTPSVKGYKRLLDLKAVSQGGTPLLVQYLIIAYQDTQTKKWKVLGAGTGENVDIDSQVAFFSENLHDPYLSEQQSYLTYGGWLLQAGKIQEARRALVTAQGSRDDGKYSGHHLLQIRALLSVIDGITGVKSDASGQPISSVPH